MTFRKIVIGYGGGDSSRDALKLAVLLQRACAAELVVAHVYRHDPALTQGHPDPRLAQRAGAIDTLREADSSLPYGATAELRPVKARSVTQGLHEIAEHEGADLIVVGSPEHRPLHSLHSATSIAERLLHAAPCAVAVAPRDFALDPDPALRVLGVAYDGGAESLAAAHVACELALASQGTLRLLGVAEPVPAPTTGVAALSGWTSPEGFGRDAVMRDLETLAEELPSSLRPQVVVADGHAADEIVKRAGTLSLLVMGSRGYGPLLRTLVGSVSGPVVRAAPCPVLVLPRGFGRADARPATAAVAPRSALG